MFRPEHLVSAIKTFGNDNYFTLYDHPDKYTQRAYKRLTSQVLLASDSYHWRTTPSTCFSFVVSRYLLEKDSDIFLIPKMEDRSSIFGIKNISESFSSRYLDTTKLKHVLGVVLQ